MGNSLTDRIIERRAWVLENRPLIHHITNFVVMNETANLTICAGALPVMAHAVEEVEEMVGLASALVLNIGTSTRNRWRPCSRRASGPTPWGSRWCWTRWAPGPPPIAPTRPGASSPRCGWR